MASLDEILSDKEPEKPAEAAPEEVERAVSNRAEWRKQEYAAQGRDPETGQFVPKEGKEEPKEEVKAEPEKVPEKPAPPRQEMSDKERALLRAAENERHKRQQIEAKIAELEKKLSEKTQEPPKPFWDDPEGAVGSLKKEIEAAKQEARQEAQKSHWRTTEAIARGKYADFDEKIAAFTELVQTNPYLQAQLMQAVDPAEFAYRTAKTKADLDAAGGLEAWQAKKEQEIRAKIEKELSEKEAKIREERSKLPQSLTDQRSVAPTKPVWSGPTSMNDILGRG